VTHVDVLDVDPANARATIKVDLARADAIADAAFDCVIVTQTLQLVYEVAAAVRHLRRIVAPGGVVLATVPTVSRLVLEPPSVDFWRFTSAACQRLFVDAFGSRSVDVTAFGNLATCTGFLAGLAAEELTAAELAAHDERFPLLVAVRAVAS
jgi:SAM-dependent methyltransferase